MFFCTNRLVYWSLFSLSQFHRLCPFALSIDSTQVYSAFKWRYLWLHGVIALEIWQTASYLVYYIVWALFILLCMYIYQTWIYFICKHMSAVTCKCIIMHILLPPKLLLLLGAWHGMDRARGRPTNKMTNVGH